MAGVLPWSYSSLSAYENCPKRYYLTRIAKLVKEPQTQATLWGNEVHKALELAVKDKTPLAERFQSYAPLVEKINAMPGEKKTEAKFGLTASFKPTTFFGKDVWFRGVIDLTVVGSKNVAVLDYKTGKPKEDGDQLKLFAGSAFAQYPWAEKVKTSYLWLAHGQLSNREFTREDVPAIWQEFAPRVHRMVVAEEENKFPPNPSGLCRNWCPVGRKLCDFCGS